MTFLPGGPIDHDMPFVLKRTEVMILRSIRKTGYMLTPDKDSDVQRLESRGLVSRQSDQPGVIRVLITDTGREAIARYDD